MEFNKKIYEEQFKKLLSYKNKKKFYIKESNASFKINKYAKKGVDSLELAEYLGKLNFYLEALDRDIKKSYENPSVGIILCKTKDSEVVEYALSRNMSPALIAEYKTKLIDKKLLEKKLREFLI